MRGGYRNGKQWLDIRHPDNIEEGYKSLKVEGEKVRWHHWVWNTFNVLKHSFIAWLVALGKLRTRERLVAVEVYSDV